MTSNIFSDQITINQETIDTKTSVDKFTITEQSLTETSIQTPSQEYWQAQDTLNAELVLRNLQTILAQYINDTVFGGSWDWDTTHAPSKNAVYDKINSMDTTISWKASVSDLFLLMWA